MKIVVVDDDRLVSSSLKTIIEKDPEIQVAGIGHSGTDAIELYERLAPDILLMDIRMDGMTGLEAGEAILRKHSHAKILFLTTFADDEYVVKALKIGAKGYLLKQNFESIVPSMKAVNIGQSVFGDEIVAKIPLLMRAGGECDLKEFDISEKEAEIIRLISEGLSNREIASSLFLGEGTVRNNISVILEKLHLRGRTQLAIFYYKNKQGGLPGGI
jgi:DNA-binding NarL/FixJ family response regulator